MMRHNPAIQRLRPLRILSGSSDQELARFDQLTYEFVAPAGEVLIGEGNPACGFFLIMSGSATVSLDGIHVGVLEPNMFFGETAILDRGPEPATVTTLTRSVLRVANRREFYELVKIHPFARSLMKTLATRQRYALHASLRPAHEPARQHLGA
jgi:CRP-like cAMP-binding protein